MLNTSSYSLDTDGNSFAARKLQQAGHVPLVSAFCPQRALSYIGKYLGRDFLREVRLHGVVTRTPHGRLLLDTWKMEHVRAEPT